MPDCHEALVSGRPRFFTVALADRESDLLVREVDLFRNAVAETRRAHPFAIRAMVVLPDHVHAVWSLPTDDDSFAARWDAVRSCFARAVDARVGLNPTLRGSPGESATGDGGIWRHGYRERALRDDADLDRHIQYCWLNPVRHGLVRRFTDWPHSTFHREVRRKTAPADAGRPAAERGFAEPPATFDPGVRRSGWAARPPYRGL